MPEQFIPKPVPAGLPAVLGYKEPPAPPLKSNRNSEGAEFGDVSKGEAVFAQSQPPASASEEPGEDVSQPNGTAIPEYFNTAERIGQAYGQAAFEEFNDLIKHGVSPEDAEKQISENHPKRTKSEEKTSTVIEDTSKPALIDKLNPQGEKGDFMPTPDLIEEESPPNDLSSQGESPANAETPENTNQSNQTLPGIVLSSDTYVNATGPDGDYYGPYSGLEGRAGYTVTQYTDAAGNTRNYTPPSQVAETAVNNPTVQIHTVPDYRSYGIPELGDPETGPVPPREVSVFGPGAEQDYLRARKQAADGERARPQTGGGLDERDGNRIHRGVMQRIRNKASLLELAGSNYRSFSEMGPTDQQSWLEKTYDEVEGVRNRFGEDKDQALAIMRGILMI